MSLFSDSVQLIRVQSDGVPNPAAVSPAGSSPPGEANHSGTTIHIDKHSSSSGGSEFLAVPICAIVFTFIYLIVKAVMAPFTQRAKYARSMPPGNGGGLTPEEVAVLQKLQRTLTQMESRVEALETILIEQARTEKNYGSKL